MREAKADLDGAIADYTEAIRLDPKFADAYDGRGRIFLAKQDPNPAIADFDRALRLDPNRAEDYFLRGVVRYDRYMGFMGDGWVEKDDLLQAIADFSEAIRLDAKNPRLRYAHALASNTNGDRDRAIADLTEALRLILTTPRSPPCSSSSSRKWCRSRAVRRAACLAFPDSSDHGFDLAVQKLADARQLRPFKRGQERRRPIVSDAAETVARIVNADAKRNIKAAADVDGDDHFRDQGIADQIERTALRVRLERCGLALLDAKENHQTVRAGHGAKFRFDLVPWGAPLV